MLVIRLHQKQTKIENILAAMGQPDVRFITRPGEYFLKRVFRKIMPLVPGHNFKVYSSESDSCIEVKDGRIYYRIVDINKKDILSWLIFADEHKILVENYNTEVYLDAETGEEKRRLQIERFEHR